MPDARPPRQCAGVSVPPADVPRCSLVKEPRDTAPHASKLVHFPGYTRSVRNNNWNAGDIQQARARLGWTPQQLADALGVPRRDVEAWEAGVRTIPDQVARRFERVTAPTWSGEEIRQRRIAKDWTQKELATELGASLRSVVAWEQGTAPQGRNLAMLVRVLGDAFSGPDTDEDTPDGQADTVALRDATFADTINHLVDLYHRAERGSINRVLRVEDTPLPADFHADHDVVEGPPVDEQTGGVDASLESQQHPSE